MTTTTLPWRQAATKEIKRLARTGRPFTADDLYEKVGHPDPTHKVNSRNNVVGKIFREACEAGLIESIGWRPSRQPHRKGGVIRIWRGKGL